MIKEVVLGGGLLRVTEVITENNIDAADFRDAIIKEIDAFCDKKLNKLMTKAIKGNANDILRYNCAVINDKRTRIELKRCILEQLEIAVGEKEAV